MKSDKIMIESIRKGLADVKAEFKSIARIGIAEAERKERITEAMKGFNPDVHVMVTKEQMELTSQLETLKSMAAKVDELHAVQACKLYNTKPKPRKPTKKERENAELLQLRKDAHDRILADYKRKQAKENKL